MLDPNLSDEELMDLIKANRLDAFEELYERYFSKIFNYLKSKSNTELAEDLTQTTFIKVFDKAAKFKHEFPVSAWIYTIAKNLLMDEYRKRSTQKKYFDRLKDLFSQNEVNQTQDLWKELMLDMRELDEKNREIIILRFKEGMDFDEIAQKLNTNPVNARKMVSRALKSLKGFLEVGESV